MNKLVILLIFTSIINIQLIATDNDILIIEKKGDIVDFDISPNGCVIAYPKKDTVIVYDIKRQQEIKRIINPSENDILSIAISQDSLYLITGDKDGTLTIQSLINGNVLNIINFHRSGILDIDISSDSRYCCSGDSKGKIIVTNILTGEFSELDLNEQGEISCLCFAGNDKWIFGGTSNGSLFSFNISENKIRVFPGCHKDWVRAISVGADSKSLYSAGDDKKLNKWDISFPDNIRLIYTLQKYYSWGTACSVLPDYSAIVSGSFSGKIIFTILAGITYTYKLKAPVIKLQILSDKQRRVSVIASTYGNGLRIIPITKMKRI